MIGCVVGLLCGFAFGVGLASSVAWKLWEIQEKKWGAEVDSLDTELGILRQRLNGAGQIERHVPTRRAEP